MQLLIKGSKAFAKLVAALKTSNSTITTIEQTCGGMLASEILAQPGASRVFYGGSIVYNTQKSKAFLMNDEELYNSIATFPSTPQNSDEYVQSKIHWTAETSIKFCQTVGTDYAIAEGSFVWMRSSSKQVECNVHLY
jgi:hypothetical protein